MSVAAITWAMERRLGSSTLKYVLVALANHADDEGRCWPSQEHLAATTELSIRSVRRSLAELEERRLIARDERPRRDDKTRRSDLIQLRMEAPSDHAASVAGSSPDHAATVAASPDMLPDWPDDHAATVAGTMRPHNPNHAATVAGSYNAGTVIEPSVESSVYCPKRSRVRTKASDADFAEFWDVYPRAVGKIAARKTYDRIVVSGAATPQQILEGARRYRVERSGREAQYTAHPATWLNRGSWADGAKAADGQTAQASGFYAAAGSVELDAWTEYRRLTDGRTGLLDSRGGWTFPTRWPPSHAHTRPAGARGLTQADHILNAHRDVVRELRQRKGEAWPEDVEKFGADRRDMSDPFDSFDGLTIDGEAA